MLMQDGNSQEIIKAVKKNTPLTPGQAVAAEAVKRIDAMYHLDNMYKESSAKERLDNRQRSVKPLVDAYFAWLKHYREIKRKLQVKRSNQLFDQSGNIPSKIPGRSASSAG